MNRTRPFLLAGLLLSLAVPSFGAVTSNQLQTLVGASAGVPFRQRVEFGFVLTAEQIISESAATAKHSQRAALASAVLNNPDNYVTQFSQAVVVQLPLSTTNLVTVSGVANADVDATDIAIQNAESAIWNGLLPNP